MAHRIVPTDKQRDDLVEEFTASGMSQAAFAKEKGITTRTLRRWLRARGLGHERRVDVDVLARVERLLSEVRELLARRVRRDDPVGQASTSVAASAPPARLPMPSDMTMLV